MLDTEGEVLTVSYLYTAVASPGSRITCGKQKKANVSEQLKCEENNWRMTEHTYSAVRFGCDLLPAVSL